MFTQFPLYIASIFNFISSLFTSFLCAIQIILRSSWMVWTAQTKILFVSVLCSFLKIKRTFSCFSMIWYKSGYKPNRIDLQYHQNLCKYNEISCESFRMKSFYSLIRFDVIVRVYGTRCNWIRIFHYIMKHFINSN